MLPYTFPFPKMRPEEPQEEYFKRLITALEEVYEKITTELGTYFEETLTWNPGSLADGVGETSAAIPAPGATLGDYVMAAADQDLQGIICTAYVQATDIVKIRLQNETGGTIDLASGSFYIKVVKRK